MKPKITIAKTAGFCFGVRRAYDLACANSKNPASSAGKCGNIYILGKLVHNNDVCADLYKRGIKEIKSLNNVKKGTIIFTAHGVGPGLYKKANEKGLKIIDTTCPKVTRTQQLAKNFAGKKYAVLVFGDKNHKEVKSIFEWSGKKARIIGSLNELKKTKLDKTKKFCLISQTTQNVEEFKKTIAFLRSNLKNFIYFNTICESTDDRQKEARELAKKNDAIVVIGGRDSANSHRLYEIASKINKKSFFIENAGQLKKNWLSGIKKIAISAGASTPEWVIRDVFEKIKNFSFS